MFPAQMATSPPDTQTPSTLITGPLPTFPCCFSASLAPHMAILSSSPRDISVGLDGGDFREASMEGGGLLSASLPLFLMLSGMGGTCLKLHQLSWTGKGP